MLKKSQTSGCEMNGFIGVFFGITYPLLVCLNAATIKISLCRG